MKNLIYPQLLVHNRRIIRVATPDERGFFTKKESKVRCPDYNAGLEGDCNPCKTKMFDEQSYKGCGFYRAHRLREELKGLGSKI